MQKLSDKDIQTIHGGYNTYYYYDDNYYHTPGECLLEGALMGGLAGITFNALSGDYLGRDLGAWAITGAIVNLLIS